MNLLCKTKHRPNSAQKLAWRSQTSREKVAYPFSLFSSNSQSGSENKGENHPTERISLLLMSPIYRQDRPLQEEEKKCGPAIKINRR